MAEELRLDKVFRKGRAVDADEGRLRQGAPVMDGLGDEVFAGAGFAGDQDRRVHDRRRLDEPDDVGKAGAVADDDRSLAVLVAGVDLDLLDPFQVEGPERVLDRELEFVDVEGLGQVVVGAEAHRGDGVFEARKGGNENDLGLFVLFEDRGGEGMPLPVGELLVQEHDIDLPARAYGEPFRACIRGEHLQPVALEVVSHVIAKHLFVVDDQKRFFPLRRHPVPPADKWLRSCPGRARL